jgi:hypothetical protein
VINRPDLFLAAEFPRPDLGRGAEASIRPTQGHLVKALETLAFVSIDGFPDIPHKSNVRTYANTALLSLTWASSSGTDGSVPTAPFE